MLLLNVKGRASLKAGMGPDGKNPVPEKYPFFAVSDITISNKIRYSLEYAKKNKKAGFELDFFCGRTREYYSRQLAVRLVDPYTGKKLPRLDITSPGLPLAIHDVKAGEYEAEKTANPVRLGFSTTAFFILPFTDTESIRPTNGKKARKIPAAAPCAPVLPLSQSKNPY